MKKLVTGILPDDRRQEYVELIYAIGKRYIVHSLPNHKGLHETARALGIAYPTLKSRICDPSKRMASKWVSGEQLLAARYLWEHPVDGMNPASDLIPEPPTIPNTTREKIMCIVRDASRPVNVDEINHMLQHYHSTVMGRQTLQNRLSEMVGDELPLIVRVGSGLYTNPEWVQ